MRFLALLIVCASVLVGCASNKGQINITAAYPFEGRYGQETEIKIDGHKIAYNESVWILSNKTLYSLLSTASPNKRRAMLLQNKLDEAPRFFEMTEDPKGDLEDFCNEVYVWETWEVSTNKVVF